MDNFWGNCPITCNILVQILLRVLQKAEWRLKWAGWSWAEVDGAGWSWVHGLVIPLLEFQICFQIWSLKRLVDVWIWKKKYTILINHSVFNVYYNRMSGKSFNGLEDWVSLRCSKRYGFLEIFRIFTTLLKNSWKVSAIYNLKWYSHFREV